jgi:hypothetical protein
MLRLTSGLFCILVVSTIAAGSEESKQDEPSIRIECQGQLRHRVVASGGETTGTTVKFDGTTWELLLKDDAARKFAESHQKKLVSVSGSLRRMVGVEIPVRWIVDVEKLSEPDPQIQKESASVTFLGKLRAKVSVEDGNSVSVIEADGVSWQLDFTADATLPAKVESLAHQRVVVKGRIERIAQVTAPERMIIRVSKLDASPNAAQK